MCLCVAFHYSRVVHRVMAYDGGRRVALFIQVFAFCLELELTFEQASTSKKKQMIFYFSFIPQ